MTTSAQACIWCKRPVRKANVEHILPEALGCPPGFELRECVCMACNNGLSHVDQALVHEFEIVAFMGGVRGKKGRPPTISTWASIRGRYGPEGPEMHLNAGPQTVEAMGARLQAAHAKHGVTDVKIGPMIPDEQCTINFSQKIGRHPKFGRAIHKVALGALAYFCGATEAIDGKYDALRHYVRKGSGAFDVLILTENAGGRHFFSKPTSIDGSEFPVIEFAVFGVSFLIDTDPAQCSMDLVRKSMEENHMSDWIMLSRLA